MERRPKRQRLRVDTHPNGGETADSTETKAWNVILRTPSAWIVSPGGERHAQLLAPSHNGEVRPQMRGHKLGKLADYVENCAETASLPASSTGLWTQSNKISLFGKNHPDNV